MLGEILKSVALVATSIGVVAMSRVLVEFFRHGLKEIRAVREHGGGLLQKARGELDGGQRRPSAVRGHGLHISVGRDGKLQYREKSVIADNAV